MSANHHEHHHGCNCGHEHHEHTQSCGCGHRDQAPQEQHHAIAESMEKRVYILENLGCAHCAAKMEEAIGQRPGFRGTLRVASRVPSALSTSNSPQR